MTMITIPYDIYESQYEIIIILPLWWVKKESIELRITEYVLYISGIRSYGQLREDCIPVRQDCFRWDIKLTIDLPANITYKNMHSTLSKENILTIIIPKNVVPDNINVQIED